MSDVPQMPSSQDVVRAVVAELHEGHIRERNAVVMALGGTVSPPEFLTALIGSYVASLKWAVDAIQTHFPQEKRKSFSEYLRSMADTLDQVEKAKGE